jgi:hypothetical protein
MLPLEAVIVVSDFDVCVCVCVCVCMKPARDMQFYNYIRVPVSFVLSSSLSFPSVQKCSLLIVDDDYLLGMHLLLCRLDPDVKQ